MLASGKFLFMFFFFSKTDYTLLFHKILKYKSKVQQYCEHDIMCDFTILASSTWCNAHAVVLVNKAGISTCCVQNRLANYLYLSKKLLIIFS